MSKHTERINELRRKADKALQDFRRVVDGIARKLYVDEAPEDDNQDDLSPKERESLEHELEVLQTRPQDEQAKKRISRLENLLGM